MLRARKAQSETADLLKDQVRILVQTNRIDNPHPFLAVWMTCRSLQGDGQNRLLPEAGGVLDQDYMTTWAFGIIDETYQAELEFKRNLERNTAQMEALRRQLLAGK